MAKVVLELEDMPDGTVMFRATGDVPEEEVEWEELSTAQQMSYIAVDAMHDHTSDFTPIITH